MLQIAWKRKLILLSSSEGVRAMYTHTAHGRVLSRRSTNVLILTRIFHAICELLKYLSKRLFASLLSDEQESVKRLSR